MIPGRPFRPARPRAIHADRLSNTFGRDVDTHHDRSVEPVQPAEGPTQCGDFQLPSPALPRPPPRTRHPAIGAEPPGSGTAPRLRPASRPADRRSAGRRLDPIAGDHSLDPLQPLAATERCTERGRGERGQVRSSIRAVSAAVDRFNDLVAASLPLHEIGTGAGSEHRVDFLPAVVGRQCDEFRARTDASTHVRPAVLRLWACGHPTGRRRDVPSSRWRWPARRRPPSPPPRSRGPPP